MKQDQYIKSAQILKKTKISKATFYRFISFLCRLYPQLTDYFTEDLNLEETVLFYSKVILGETEQETYDKCLKNEYPNTWIYNFTGNASGHEFNRRYRTLTARMKLKSQQKLKGLSMEILLDSTVDLVEFVQLKNREERDAMNDIEGKNTTPSTEEAKKEEHICNLIIRRVSDCIQKFSKIDEDGATYLNYLFGFIDYNELRTNISTKNWRKFNRPRPNRERPGFRIDYMARIYDFLPLCLQYELFYSDNVETIINKLKSNL